MVDTFGGNAVDALDSHDSGSMLRELYAWYLHSQKRTSPGVIYRGVVVDNVDPDGYGRVRVVIEGLTATKATKKEAMWAWTLVNFGPGQQSGAVWGSFMPYMIGSTVWIAFAQSDSEYDNPIVLGGWAHKNQRPEECYDTKQKGKKIPRAWGWKSPKGHTMEYREEDDEEMIMFKTFGGTTGSRKIVLSDKKDNELIAMVGAKGGEILLKEGKDGTKITLIDPAGNTIQMDEKSKSILVSSVGNLTLTAKDVVTISAGTGVQVMSKTVAVTGSEQASFMSGVGGDTLIGSALSNTNIDGLSIDIGSMTSISMLSTTSTSIKALTTLDMLSTSTTSITATGGLTITGATLNITSLAACSIISSAVCSITSAGLLALVGSPVTSSNPL